MNNNDPKKHEDLLVRIGNRIDYLRNIDAETKKQLIQNEPQDAIRKHFCELFNIPYIEDTN